jgi:hypothetical protein
MSDLTAKFTTLETQLAAQEAAADIDRNVTNVKLQNILDFLDVMNINNATNTRLILAAIGQNSACAVCPTPPLTVPPIIDLTPTVDSDKCKRTQAFLDAVQAMLTVWDTFSSFDITANVNIITDAISQVIAELAAGDTIPLPSFPEGVQLAGLILSFTGYNLFAGTSLVSEFAPMKSSLQSGIYAGTSIEDMKSVYDGIVTAGVTSGYLSDVMVATAYNALWSYFFDPATDPDLTGYSGTLCIPADCYNFDSQSVTITGFGARQAIVWTAPFTGQNTDPVGGTYSANQVLVGDFYGARFRRLSGEGNRVVYWVGGTQIVVSTMPATYVLEAHTSYLYLDNFLHGTTFSIEFCVAGAWE